MLARASNSCARCDRSRTDFISTRRRSLAGWERQLLPQHFFHNNKGCPNGLDVSSARVRRFFVGSAAWRFPGRGGSLAALLAGGAAHALHPDDEEAVRRALEGEAQPELGEPAAEDVGVAVLGAEQRREGVLRGQR